MLSGSGVCPTSRIPNRVLVIIKEMHRRGTCYWAWSADEWIETMGWTAAAFNQRHGLMPGDHRHPVVLMAYLLAEFSDFSRFPPGGLPETLIAARLFGRRIMHAAAERASVAVEQWGYADQGRQLRYTVARACLANRSPHLEDLTLDLLASLREKARSKEMFGHLGLLSRALVALGILPAPLPPGRPGRPLAESIATEGIAPEWVAWCLSWHARSTLTPKVRDTYLYRLLLVGRWLAQEHPHVTSPEHWDYDLVAEYIATVDRLTIGDWAHDAGKRIHRRSQGKPLGASSKAAYFQVMTRFFSDLQDIPHRLGPDDTGRLIARRFNPVLAFRTPRSIRALIGPDPRVIDDAWWWKLVAAAETLTAADLPGSDRASAKYPIAYVRAVGATWCYAARRADEIARLRVGCIRWQVETGMVSETGVPLPQDAVCLLRIPVNKTNTAFTVPVFALVGKRIEDWEKVRPPQPKALDPKTNEMVDFLFSYRGRRLAREYITNVLIPVLCKKAGVPLADKRGKITSHRARATIATALYNCPDGLTIAEMQQFLGHRHSSSTQAYIKVSATKLATSVARANKNARLARAILDPHAAMQGQPAIFYDLGDGTFCGNPAWASCAHRMACLKCPFHVGQTMAQTIRARDGIVSVLVEVPDLTPDEIAAAEGDRDKLTALIEKNKHQPTPVVADARFVFNPAALTRHASRPLPVINPSPERRADPAIHEEG